MFSLIGIVLLGVSGYIASLYMPETVPVHFNIVGNPDGYGSPDYFFFWTCILAGILLFICVLLSLLRLFPNYFNYPVEITTENAVTQYQIGVDLIYVMKIGIVLTFLFIQIMIIYSSFNGKIGYTFLLVFLPIILMFYYIGSFTRKSLKNK